MVAVKALEQSRGQRMPRHTTQGVIGEQIARCQIPHDILARRIGVNTKQIEKWIRGICIPQQRLVKVIALQCGIPHDWLVKAQFHASHSPKTKVKPPVVRKPAVLKREPISMKQCQHLVDELHKLDPDLRDSVISLAMLK